MTNLPDRLTALPRYDNVVIQDCGSSRVVETVVVWSDVAALLREAAELRQQQYDETHMPDGCPVNCLRELPRYDYVSDPNGVDGPYVRWSDVEAALARAEGPTCEICGNPATCYGQYEHPGDPAVYHCDSCCGHGNEDGWCKPLPAPPASSARPLWQCEGCRRYVDPDPETPEGRGHQVPNADGSPGYCGPISDPSARPAEPTKESE